VTDIGSFNELFTQAKRRGLRLHTFCQGFDGLFQATWRIDDPRFWVGPIARHERPFDAALNAFALADLQAPHVKAQTVDLFD
jgi:hypothetical protein